MVIFISFAIEQKTIKNILILQVLTKKKIHPPIFLLSSLCVSFFFMLTQEQSCETLEDRFIWLGMFLSFIALGFVLSKYFD
jgi:hypothetical protein